MMFRKIFYKKENLAKTNQRKNLVSTLCLKELEEESILDILETLGIFLDAIYLEYFLM